MLKQAMNREVFESLTLNNSLTELTEYTTWVDALAHRGWCLVMCDCAKHKNTKSSKVANKDVAFVGFLHQANMSNTKEFQAVMCAILDRIKK